ncbi:hypothetical protein NGB36_31900 [Streptomyces sp. RB6PN25]|uniref:Uncharacterized protein n=1 Tax=Streptomyces humicola TaxID=2953240 RepID=A0ABT1Q6M3_9ACTN|nr:hypothetical protein [Streptomyces humicola]MCQ4085043.1 hypothetical protein [Streptomyces humicola]
MTPELIHSLATWTWLERTAVGQVAFVLVAPRAHSADAVRGLAAALGLREPSCRLPYVGERVTVHGSSRARLHPDGWAHAIGLTVGARWSRYVVEGGPVAVLVGLDPLTPCAQPDAVNEYVITRTRGNRLRMGTASMRRVW